MASRDFISTILEEQNERRSSLRGWRKKYPWLNIDADEPPLPPVEPPEEPPLEPPIEPPGYGTYPVGVDYGITEEQRHENEVQRLRYILDSPDTSTGDKLEAAGLLIRLKARPPKPALAPTKFKKTVPEKDIVVPFPFPENEEQREANHKAFREYRRQGGTLTADAWRKVGVTRERPDLSPHDVGRVMFGMPTQEEMVQQRRAYLEDKPLLGQFSAGIGDVIQSMGGAAKWMGFDKAGQRFREMGQGISEDIAPVDLGDLTWESIFDPNFWQNLPQAVVRATPFTLSLVPAMFTGWGLGAGVAGALGASPFWTTVISAVGATTLSRPMESALEAGNTYNEALERGMTEQQADEAALGVFLKNLSLSGFDVAELALTFARIPGGGRHIRLLQPVGKVGGVAFTEAGEEILQDWFQRQGLGDPMRLDEQLKQVALLGGIMGASMGGAGAVFTSIANNVQQQMTPSMDEKFNADIARAEKQGMSHEEAVVFALDELAKTPEGKAVVEAAVQQAQQEDTQIPIAPSVQVQRDTRMEAGQEPDITPAQVPGEPEAGVQAGFLGEDKIVRPKGKGRITQSSMDDFAKLQEQRQAEVEPDLSSLEKRIAEVDKLLATKGKLPAGMGTKAQLELERARLEAEYNLSDATTVERIDSAIERVETELGLRALPYHGRSPNVFPQFNTKQLNEILTVYQEAKYQMMGIGDVSQVQALAVEKQPQLNDILKNISEPLGLRWKGNVKSLESMVDKIQRKGSGYDVYSMKDHTRGTIILSPDYTEIENIVKALTKQQGMNIENSIDEPLNIFGYRGIHVNFSLGEGVNAEVQLHTEASWDIKQQTDEIYRRWRKYEKQGKYEVPKILEVDYRADINTSYDLWNNYWLGVGTEFKVRISSSLRYLASKVAPSLPSKSTQLPSESSTFIQSPLAKGEISITRPSSSLAKSGLGITTPPKTTISQEVSAGQVTPKTLTSQIKEIYSDIESNIQATKAGLKGLKGDEARAARQSLKLLEKELANINKLLDNVNQAGTDVKAMRQKIMAISAFKGLPETQRRDIFKKTTGISRLTSMTPTQLEEVLKAISKARPKTIKGRRVVTLGTENAIKSLKAELINSGKLSEEAYQDIKRYLKVSVDRYVSSNLFLTESEGKALLKHMNYVAELGLVEHDTKVAESLTGKDKIASAIGDLNNRIAKSNDPYINGKPVGVSSWWDMRYYTMKLQNRTGGKGRFYDVWFRANEKRLENKVKAAELQKQIESSTHAYKKIAGDEEALLRVSDYIASKHKMGPKSPENITEDEIKVANAIEKVLFGFQPDVRYWRFWRSYQQHGDNVIQIINDIPDASKESIREAIKIYESKGADALRQYLDTQEWGIIGTGYEPHIAVNHRLHRPKIKDYVVGKGHLNSREGFQPLTQKDNIIQRTQQYVNQMSNLSLEPYLKELDRIFSETADMFKDSSKVQRDLSLSMQEMKGYMTDRTPMIELLSKFASIGYSAIFLSPHLSYRNLHQNLALHPDREAFLNPSNRKLSEEEREFVKHYVSQFKSFARDILLQQDLGSSKLARGVKGITYYGYSDEVNRIASFWASVNKAERALRQYHKDGDVDKFIKGSGLNDLTFEQQKQTLEYMALDEVFYGGEVISGEQAAKRNIARQITNNTHFLYDRAERAPMEMGSAARILTSLLVFSRSYGQRLYNQINEARPNSTASRAQKVRAWKVIMGILVMGYLSGELYRRTTGKKRNPYDPLNVLSWQPGGLPLGLAIDAGDALFTIVEAARGNEYAMAELPEKMTRLGDAMIPLYASLINILESATDTKYVDRQALRKIRAMFDKDYMPNDEFYAQERGWIGKVQHALFGGEETQPTDVENSIATIEEGIPKLGMIDNEAREKALEGAETFNDKKKIQARDWTYTMSDLRSDIYFALKGIDLDLITEEEGYPPIVQDYLDAQPLIEDYFDLMADDRWEYREENPETEAALVIWNGYKKMSTPECEAIVRRFVQNYRIPESAIPALATAVEEEKPTRTRGMTDNIIELRQKLGKHQPRLHRIPENLRAIGVKSGDYGGSPSYRSRGITIPESLRAIGVKSGDYGGSPSYRSRGITIPESLRAIGVK